MPAKQTEKRPPLPRRQNPLVGPDKTGDHDELVKMRRLGQTDLTPELVRAGTVNGTKPESNLAYAHLQVPLPQNLKNSEIFAPHPHHGSHIGKYYLMRRCSDGFVSATGMFKMSFPWAKNSEELIEREYIKNLDSAGTSEIESAGNIWIPERFALELAEEYGIVPWVKALLDEEIIPEIKVSGDGGSDDQNCDPKSKHKKPIPQPPRFEFTANDRTYLPPPSTPRHATPRSRGRPRGSSPTKNGTVAARTATPRKLRAFKENKESNAANMAREVSTASFDNAASTTSEPVNGEIVSVKLESVVQVNGDTETTTTNVRVDIPELSAPESPDKMIEKAKEIVEEARKLEGEISSRPKSKRKAEVLEDSDAAATNDGSPPVKKMRLLEQELKREKVQKRALIGVTAALVVGTIISNVL